MNGLDLRELFSLDGKVALVTGGSRGIGYMISQGLLQAGARVYITARHADACREAAGQLGQYGPCEAIPIDVNDAGARRELTEILSGHEGKLDILVNNAGTSWGDRYEDYAAEAFDKVFRLNVSSVFAMTRDFTPLLERAASKEEPSRVINIGSGPTRTLPARPRYTT
jgi:NAD(P)-dependent dehydrogenase (short-subunit alcohol dehydrogenase family)